MGFAAAELFSKHGWQVFTGARRLERMKELKKFGVETFFLIFLRMTQLKLFFGRFYKKTMISMF
ncbi:hypothetical protein [Oenococcus oeni]|nr:hypothetical protein [Oenococcus oeni]